MKKYRSWVAMLLVVSLFLAISPSLSDAAEGKININTAPVEVLEQLDQVGLKTAERIVEYRKANGPFKAPEDLMKVKGIGEKIFQKNKERISI